LTKRTKGKDRGRERERERENARENEKETVCERWKKRARDRKVTLSLREATRRKEHAIGI